MNTSIGERLKAVRTQKKIKQIDAAKALGVSHGLLSHYENGVRQCGPDFLRAASRYYGVTTDYLLGLTDVNAALPASHPSPEASDGYQTITDMITGLYSLLAVIDDKELSSSTTDYIASNLYRIFRPLFDVHQIPYDTQFFVTSDTFSLCSAAALLSETALLIRLRSLSPEKTSTLRELSLEDVAPVNYRSFFESMKQIDARIFRCAPVTDTLISDAPLSPAPESAADMK